MILSSVFTVYEIENVTTKTRSTIIMMVVGTYMYLVCQESNPPAPDHLFQDDLQG